MVKNAESWSLKRFSNYPDTTSEISSMKRIIFTILIHVAYSNLSLALVSPTYSKFQTSRQTRFLEAGISRKRYKSSSPFIISVLC